MGGNFPTSIPLRGESKNINTIGGMVLDKEEIKPIIHEVIQEREEQAEYEFNAWYKFYFTLGFTIIFIVYILAG